MASTTTISQQPEQHSWLVIYERSCMSDTTAGVSANSITCSRIDWANQFLSLSNFNCLRKLVLSWQCCMFLPGQTLPHIWQDKANKFFFVSFFYTSSFVFVVVKWKMTRWFGTWFDYLLGFCLTTGLDNHVQHKPPPPLRTTSNRIWW